MSLPLCAQGFRRSLRTDIAMALFLDALCVKLAQFPGFADLFVDTVTEGIYIERDK